MTTKQPDWEAIERACLTGLRVGGQWEARFYFAYLMVALTNN